MTLWILFTSAFISSTLFPGGSEAVLAYIANQENHYSVGLLILIATVGNTLGGMTSWGLGRLIAIKYSSENLVEPSHQAALIRIEKYGSPVLLLSWLPVIGDPLCLVAGWLRINWFLSLVYIGIGKALRYIVVIYLFA